MTSYYWVVGMAYPYWRVSDQVANNQESDTDLTPEEFKRWFPRAMPITEDEYENRSVTLEQYMRWRRR